MLGSDPRPPPSEAPREATAPDPTGGARSLPAPATRPPDPTIATPWAAPMEGPTGLATTAPIVADDVLGLGDTVKGGRLGAIYDLVALRTGEHPGFSRVVWELAAHDKSVTSAPLWEIVEQGNETLAEGADRLEGKVHIRLRLADTYAMNFVGALSANLPANPLVHGVRLLPVEDDSSLYFAIDLAEAAPYKVSVLEAPLRVVIDVYRP